MAGDVIGIVSHVISKSGGSEGLFNLPPKTGGLLVKTVAPGSLGEAMGIKGGRKTAIVDGQPLVVGGDIILNVQGIAVTTAADLAKIRERTSQLGRAAPVTITVLRAGRQLKLTGKMPWALRTR